MTPFEKAKDLIDTFARMDGYDDSIDLSKCEFEKQCALIVVDLLIECTPSMNIYPPNFQTKHPRVKEYWQEVKQEIINL